jgi:hypothetical protein
MLWQMEMADALTAAPAAARAEIMAGYVERTGFSTARLYQLAKAHGFTSGRKKREDAGEVKCGITDQQLTFIAGLLSESAREDKGVIMPVERALEIATDPRNGVIKPGQISVGGLQRLLRERQINKDALDAETPSTDMRSLHPNYCHQIDASVCIQYYLKNGKTALIDERDYNDKKPANMAKIKQRLTRYLITDHFSGAFYVKYYVADGESSNILYDFLLSAWKHKKDAKFPFRGVPFYILWDAASAARAKAMRHFIEALGIITPAGMPHNPRRQGSVETTQNIVEEWFESGLRFQPAFNVEQLNEWAYDWCVYHNASKKHTRHGMKRTECWMLATSEQIRELPEQNILNACYSYTSEDLTRLVNANYTITFAMKAGEVKTYHLKHVPGLLPTRSRVQVRIKPYLWPVIDVLYNEQAYEVTPVEMLPAVQGGFRADAAVIGASFNRQPETATQQAIKRIENYAYGEEKGKDALPFAGIQVMGGQADRLGNMEYMPKSGTAIEFDRGIADAEIPIMELFGLIRQHCMEMTPALNQALRARHGASIKKSEAEEVVQQLQNGTWGKQAAKMGIDQSMPDVAAM